MLSDIYLFHLSMAVLVGFIETVGFIRSLVSTISRLSLMVHLGELYFVLFLFLNGNV